MNLQIHFNSAVAGHHPSLERPDQSPLTLHRSFSEYEPTPLHECPSIARRLGVARVLLKDESRRLGLPAFKILGASWAVVSAIRSAWLDASSTAVDLASIQAELGAPEGRGLVAATDGNHGRGVARMAKLLGLECRILVPAGTAEARIDAIRSEGAEVSVIQGTYDDAIAASARLADDANLVVSDTSWPGYEEIPQAVVDGYSTMFFEVDDQLRARGLAQPDLVSLQAGVGAFASAALRHYRPDPAATSPVTVLVEPASANCLMASAIAGQVTEVPGPHTSTMAGLNCGLPSRSAWPVLAARTDAFIAVEDHWAEEAMRALAGEGIEAGESGAAGLAGLLAAVHANDSEQLSRLGMTSESTVLVVNTEGATDPENYRAVLAAGQPVTV